jgi:hypothetical protein
MMGVSPPAIKRRCLHLRMRIISIVMRGLDPRIHSEPQVSMDHRVKPGGDDDAKGRHCERSNPGRLAITVRRFWIASSLPLLAMTKTVRGGEV